MYKRLINMITAIAVGALVVTSCNNDDHHKEFTQDWDPSYLWAVIQTIGVPEPDGHYAPSDSVITIDNIESFDPTDSTFYFRNTEYLDSVAFPAPPHEIYFFNQNQLLFRANLSAIHSSYLVPGLVLMKEMIYGGPQGLSVYRLHLVQAYTDGSLTNGTNYEQQSKGFTMMLNILGRNGRLVIKN